MKYIIYLLLLISVNASAQIKTASIASEKGIVRIGLNSGDYHCEPAELEITDTVLNVGSDNCKEWLGNAFETVIDEYGRRAFSMNHIWTYQDQAALTMFPYIHAKSYSGGCPTVYVADYERICERCLRHERYKEIQHYQKVEKSKSKFERLKAKIKE